MAFAPEPIGAYVGQPLDPDVMKKIAIEGARTIPGREHGGNCDVRQILLLIDGFLLPSQIKNLSRCSSSASLSHFVIQALKHVVEDHDAISQCSLKEQTFPLEIYISPKAMCVHLIPINFDLSV